MDIVCLPPNCQPLHKVPYLKKLGHLIPYRNCSEKPFPLREPNKFALPCLSVTPTGLESKSYHISCYILLATLSHQNHFCYMVTLICMNSQNNANIVLSTFVYTKELKNNNNTFCFSTNRLLLRYKIPHSHNIHKTFNFLMEHVFSWVHYVYPVYPQHTSSLEEYDKGCHICLANVFSKYTESTREKKVRGTYTRGTLLNDLYAQCS